MLCRKEGRNYGATSTGHPLAKNASRNIGRSTPRLRRSRCEAGLSPADSLIEIFWGYAPGSGLALNVDYSCEREYAPASRSSSKFPEP